MWLEKLSAQEVKYDILFLSVLSKAIDKFAPLKTISCRSRPNKPFITPEILSEKSKRSVLETLFRRSQSPEDKANLNKQANLVSKLIRSAKRSYYRKAISSNQYNPKMLWKVLDSLLCRRTPPSIPHSDSSSSMATFFLNYFNDKIVKLCTSIPPSNLSRTSDILYNANSPTMSMFTPATIDEIRKHILSLTDATCSTYISRYRTV